MKVTLINKDTCKLLAIQPLVLLMFIISIPDSSNTVICDILYDILFNVP